MKWFKSRLIIIILAITALVVSSKIFLNSKYVVPILMYHSMDEKHMESKLSVCPLNFEKQMNFLHKYNYNVISLNELVHIIKDEKKIPPKTVAVTFDDGYENNYLCAFPALKKYNIPATIFVVVNHIGEDGYLSWAQINEMIKSGLVSIGSHTLNHAYLPSVTNKTQLREEIFKSKKILEAMTHQKNMFFSYPVGGFNKEVRMLAEEAGYAGACATNPGKKYPKNDVYALKRIRISRTSDKLFVFWIESSGYYTFIKEIRDEN